MIRSIVILKMCGIELLFDQAVVGTAAAQLGLLAGITPGGLGLMEGGWAGALTYYQIRPTAIGTFLIINRFAIFSSVLILASVFYLSDKITALLNRPLKNCGH